MKVRHLAVIGVVLAAMVVIFFVRMRGSEPQYGSHPLSYWLSVLQSDEGNSNAASSYATNAIRAIGTNAYTLLVKRMGAKEGKIKGFLREEVGLRFENRASVSREEAGIGLSIIGPQLGPWIPGLMQDLTNARGSAPRILAAIGEPALSSVTACLTSDNSHVQLGAAATFILFTCDTRPAKGALTKALEHPDRRIGTGAALALAKMKPPEEAVNLFVESLESTNQSLVIASIRGLRYMGPGAASAVPALLKAAGRTNAEVSTSASNAIFWIKQLTTIWGEAR